MNAVRLFVAGVALCASVGALALSLPSYVKTVVHYSPSLKSDAKTLNANLAKADETYAALLPKIDVTATANMGDYRVNSAPVGSQGDDLVVAMHQPIINMGGAGMVRAARIGRYLAELHYAIAYQDNIEKAAKAYFETLKGYQLSQLALANVAMLKAAKNEAKVAYKQEVLPKSQYAFATASYQEAKAKNYSAQALLTVSSDSLSQLAGRNIHSIIPLKSVQQLHLPVLPAQKDLQKKAMGRNLYLRFANSNSRFLHDELLALALDRLPTVEAYAAYVRVYSRGVYSVGTTVTNFTTLGSNAAQGSMVGLKVSWPLFEGGFKINKLRNMKFLYEAALQKIDDVRQKVSIGVSQYYIKTLADRGAVNADFASIKSNVIARDILQQQFDAGEKTLFDLLQVQTKLVEAKNNLVKDEVEYFEDYINLERVVGDLDVNTLKKLGVYFKRASSISVK